MTQNSALEVQGDFSSHPFAELLVEISQARLSGSLRLVNGDKKAILYFEDGRFAFAVSNERRFRLSDILFSEKLIDDAAVCSMVKATNDLELVEKLVTSNKLTREQADQAILIQCQAIIASILEWPEGHWTFSPLARLKAGVSFDIAVNKILIAHSRKLPAGYVTGRLLNCNETFALSSELDLGLELQPQETFVLTRLDPGAPSRFGEILAVSGLPDAGAMQAIYSLWLGGLLERCNWNSAFNDAQVGAIRSATLERKKTVAPARPVIPTPVQVPSAADQTQPLHETPEIEITLDDYLECVERAQSLYEVLGIPNQAKPTGIRQAYFNLAKRFHPDRFHREDPEIKRRIENAFTQIAQAHETLRNPDSRKRYDVRLEQEVKDRELFKSAGDDTARPAQESQASGDFERGFALQLRGEFEAALPYLARAVHYSPRNARYRAFYGKALSYDENKKHKAEQELQSAIKFEPENASFRIMLAEFFIRMKLLKRAEGELNRLMAKSPNNSEARSLLDSLQPK